MLNIKYNSISKNKIPKFILANGKEIDLEMLIVAMEDGSYELHWFFDAATGEVESYSEDFVEEFEKDMEEMENNPDMHAIPKLETWKSYNFMFDFNEEAVKARNLPLYKKLSIALDGKGAFRRFKDILHDDAELLNEWYIYKDNKIANIAEDWLGEIGVEFKIEAN
jgi:hypothetical protein